MGRSQGGLEFFDAGSQDRAAVEIFEIPLAAECVDLLAYGVGHMAESGIEDVENCLAGVLEDAFLKTFLEAFLEAFLTAFLTTFDETFLDTFLETFFKGEFFEECDVGHGFFG